ncbi:MAG: hypothetical protein CHACPFDD_02562 [Phycisphaerae bacterium]|nr:hypothetical protein [Phycisphaerae bacterium]
MSSAPARRRTERAPESTEFESSATWGPGSLRIVSESSGSIESQHPDPVIRMRRPNPSPFFEKPAAEEPLSDFTFVLGPASGWAQPTLQAAMLGVFGQSQVGSSQTWHSTGVHSFRPQAIGTPIRVPLVSDEARFRALAALWRRDTFNISSTSRMAMHSAYQRIIGMGLVAVPLILRELQERPDWWFWALQAITGVDPVPPSWRGSLREMAAAWLAWGQEHGYLAR